MLKPIRYAIPAVAAFTCLAFLQDDFDPEQKQLLIASFEEVWTAVKDIHYDPDLGGLDWQGVYEKYRPRIENASSNEEGRDIMNEMLGLLGQTHIGVIPASAYDDLHGKNKGDYTPGIELRILDGRAIVTRVEARSPAGALGVKPGWEIIRVDGKPVAPIIERNEETYSKTTLKDMNGAKAVEGLINGQASQAVEIEFNDGKGVKTLKLDRAEPKGEKTTFGAMPSDHFWVETSYTKDDVRIISFNIWLNP
ncbi:MAG: hypothetical protein LBQ86_00330, partial [Holophagales bacterium]|nr:hypothetical protein [Holophagales bacterium]